MNTGVKAFENTKIRFKILFLWKESVFFVLMVAEAS